MFHVERYLILGVQFYGSDKPVDSVCLVPRGTFIFNNLIVSLKWLSTHYLKLQS